MDDMEEKVIQKLESDILFPDTLYSKDYITRPVQSKESGTDTAWIAASWLAEHIDLLQKEYAGWSYYTTKVTEADISKRRILEIMKEPFFNEGRPIAKAVHIRNFKGEDIGYFDFITVSSNSGKPAVSFVTLLKNNFRNDGEELSCVLYYWSLARAMNQRIISNELGLSDSFTASVVLLMPPPGRNDSNDIRKRAGSPVWQAARALNVIPKTLFQGALARPFSSESWMEGELTEQKLISLLESDSSDLKQLCQKPYINHEGLTADTRVPYVKAISGWLEAHPVKIQEQDGSYNFLDRMSGEEAEKNLPFSQLRKQNVLPPLGQILPRYFTFLGSRGQRVGFPSLLVYSAKGERKYPSLQILEVPDPSDSLLRVVLKIKIHMDSLSVKQLISDLGLPSQTTVKPAIFIVENSLQYQLFQRDYSFVGPLMKKWNISIFVLHKGMEALS